MWFFTGYIKPVIGPVLINILYRNNQEKKGEKDFNNKLFIEYCSDKIEQNKLDNILVNWFYKISWNDIWDGRQRIN